jgi:pimeloyl-ACP methyl ester carboxylesterase
LLIPCKLASFLNFREFKDWKADPSYRGENHKTGNPGFMTRWDTSEEVKNINVPTLVINGVEEMASGDAVKPFLDSIPDVRLVTFEKSTHCPHLEEREEYMKVVGAFLL